VERPVEVPLTEEERLDRLLAATEESLTAAALRAATEAIQESSTPDPRQIERIQRLWEILATRPPLSADDQLLGANIALLTGDKRLALARLQPIDLRTPRSQPTANLQLGAELYRDLGNWLASLQIRVVLDDRFAGDPAARMSNQRHVWRLLAMLEDPELNRIATNTEPDSFDHALAGWASLFQELRAANLDPERVTRNFANWQTRYGNHPGTLWMRELSELRLRSPEEALRVAVLLPLSGPMQELGESVLEGILTQFYSLPALAASELMILDTAGDPQTARSAYEEAIATGADRVIGPLTRPEVDRIVEQGIVVPTLLLNRPSLPMAPPFSALALAPEEDARVAATRALDAGDRNAIMLLPAGEFGDRVGTSFRRHFETGGGQIVAEYRLDPAAEDINERVGAALGVEESRQRIRRTQRVLRLDLEADPQIRPELQTILLAGGARDLRMLVPHLHYHRASHLRLLATSHAYEGFPQPTRDGDLGGIEFPDAPLLHRNELVGVTNAQYIPEPPEDLQSRWLRFAALGMDAMTATAMLSEMQTAIHLRVQGAAGTWSLRPYTGLWVREPVWMEFRDGLPQPSTRQPALTAATPG
jgi:outer membrane PBP1 activator LpoA protein